MHLSFDRHPVSLIFCMIWSVIATFFVLLDINNLIRIILSIPMIIFIPGYLLVYALFPERTEKGFDAVDRIALGLGISIAIVPLLGIALFIFSRFELQRIILSLEAFILIMGTIAVIRWYHTPPEKRYIPKINISIPKHETKFDKLLTIILVACVIITVSIAIYSILTPKREEHFTEFYILGSNHLAYHYPMNLTSNKNATVILGIVNHEKTTMNYSIEVWLSNQTTQFNTSASINETIYHNFWYMGKIKDPKTNLTYMNLPPQPINLEEMQTSQWETNYTINITQLNLTQNKTYKLVFLLYTTQTQNYIKNKDYKMIATEKADSDHTTAYRDLYLWINVQ